MHASHEQSILFDAILIGIIVAYLIIAWQFLHFTRRKTGPAKKALLQLVGIFVFCSLCGYLPRLIDMPYWLIGLLHLALLTVTMCYAFSGNVRFLADATKYQDEQDKDP